MIKAIFTGLLIAVVYGLCIYLYFWLEITRVTHETTCLSCRKREYHTKHDNLMQ